MNLITGGTGMVGMHLIAGLLRRGEPVRALLRAGSSHSATDQFLQYCKLNPADVEWVDGDVLDVASLEDAMAGCSTVYHAAAVVSFHRRDRAMLYDVNINGTANVVNVALTGGCPRLVYISSVAALGRNSRGIPTNETSEWKDGPHLTHYSCSKHLAEREVWRGHEEGLEVVVVNPSVILGIGDFDRSSAAIFNQVKKGLPFYPQGSNGFVAVQDVVAACFHLIDHGHFNRRFLLNGDHMSFKDLFVSIAHALDVTPPTKPVQPWMLRAALFIAWVQQTFTGRKAFITRENVRNAGLTLRYENDRIINETGFNFTPLKNVIDETAYYMKTHNI
jgi:dihydroflavonol-4-reductase